MKLFNLAKNILFSNCKRLEAPYKLTLALTYKCNLKCTICQIWREKPKKELSAQEIKRFFRKNNYFNWVDLTGGEIFLRDDLVKIVDLAVKNCKNLYLLHFPTNGFLTEKIVVDTKKILELSPHRLIVTVSLDGPEELHNKLRGVGGSWKRAIETYKRLKKIKKKNLEVYLGMTLSKHNLGVINKVVQEVKALIPKFSHSDLHLNIAQTSGHYYKNIGVDLGVDGRVMTEIEKFRKKKREGFSGVQFLENQYQKLTRKYVRTGKSPLPCQALSASLFVDPYGNIYPCAIWDKKISNLKDSNFDLKKIWNLSKVKETRKKVVANQCPGCWTPCEAYQTILGNLI